MSYSARWKVLEDIVADFRKRGMTIPANVMSDLKSAKTMITVLKADPQRRDTAQRIEEYLENVEAYLVSKVQEHFGVEFADEWMKKLNEAARKKHVEEIEEEEARFVPGLPREQKWIRIQSSAEMPVEALKRLAEENGLSCTMQSDGYLLVFGEDQRIRGFVKKMATKYGLKAEK